MGDGATPRGIQFAREDFIEVVVNADVPLGKSRFKVVTFDARFKRSTPEELEQIAKREIDAIDFVRQKLMSTNGIRDVNGNSCDVVDLIDGDDQALAAHEATLDAFLLTHPLPQQALIAYARNQGKAKN